MKKLLLVTIVLLSANLVFAFEKNGKRNFMSGKTNNFSFHHDHSLVFGKYFVKRENKLDKNIGEGGDSFVKGKIIFSAGYGFPNLGKAIMTALIAEGSNVKATGLGPLHIKGEYALSDGVGLGISANYVSFGATWNSYDETGNITYNNDFSRSSLSILARINFHFSTSESLDPYFGVGAGYRQATWKFTTNDPNNVDNIKAPGFSPFGFETTIGLRYYFTPEFGLYTELGFAKSAIQAGIVVAL